MKTNLKSLGEFGWINSMASGFKSLIPEGVTGIGDDCAVIPRNEEYDYIVTTDMLVENIHFLPGRISPEDLGHKSLAVNLSDIAAMGGRPIGSFLSIGIPESTDISVLNGFISGYRSLSEKTGTPLLGGDTTSSGGGLVINVTVIGECKKGQAKLRASALPGDIICVTGIVGDSAGGLQVLLENKEFSPVNDKLLNAHHRPYPHLSEGEWLGKYSEVHAMMDVSDGIASDIKHIVKASEVNISIDLSRLPVSEELRLASEQYGWNMEYLATSVGEDYILMLTINPDAFNEISIAFKELFGRPLYTIGKVTGSCKKDKTSEAPVIEWLRSGNTVKFNATGFDHFKNR